MLKTNVITDRNGRHKVLLPIDQNYANHLDIFIRKTTVNLAACVTTAHTLYMYCSISTYAVQSHFPISLFNRK